MTTRATILSRAFARIGITDYVYAVNPDERADARASLDAMLAEWAEAGVDLGHIPSADDDNDAVAMATPSWSDQAVWSSLAVRLAPEFGKTPAGALLKDAKRGYDLCSAKTMTIPTEYQVRGRLRGGGDRLGRYRQTDGAVVVDGPYIVVSDS